MLTVHYPVEDFEDPNLTGSTTNTKMVSKFWESLDAKFTTRLSRSITDITLYFRTMLATYDEILLDAPTEGLLDLLASAILGSCRRLTTFSVHIGTSRYYPKEKCDTGIEGRTTDGEWEVIGQIMAMVIRVVSGLAVLKEDNLSLKLNDSRECLPYLQSR